MTESALSARGTGIDASPSMPPPAAVPDCVGPIVIPPGLRRVLHSLAIAASVDDFVPLWICAAELARRWSRERRPVSVQVIRGTREAVVVVPPRAASVRPVSFRVALRCAAEHPAIPETAGPVDVAILVSSDGDRLYVDPMTGDPDPRALAQSLLQLLCTAAGAPDAPLIGSPLPAKPIEPSTRAVS